MKISVAVVTYNGSKFLREQIDSILMNLSPEDEIIVSDDGSTDGTLEILASYEDARIRVVEGPHKGVKQNVAHALSHCSGDYIFLADQDDVWTADKVAQVMAVYERTGAHLIVHDNCVVTEDGETVLEPSFFAKKNSGSGARKNIWVNTYIGCCMAFHKDLLPYVLPIPDDIEMHDQWIGILNDHFFKDTQFVHTCLLYYRRHGANTSSFKHYGIWKMITKRVIISMRYLRRIR